MAEHESYTGPCRYPECDETFVGVSYPTLARHLKEHFGWTTDDIDELVAATKMVIGSQQKNEIDPWGSDDGRR